MKHWERCGGGGNLGGRPPTSEGLIFGFEPVVGHELVTRLTDFTFEGHALTFELRSAALRNLIETANGMSKDGNPLPNQVKGYSYKEVEKQIFVAVERTIKSHLYLSFAIYQKVKGNNVDGEPLQVADATGDLFISHVNIIKRREKSEVKSRNGFTM